MQYDYSETVEYLLHWFDYNARILRWRIEPSAYYIWISEIMLQQTRVEAVKTYFDHFVEELPDIKALAECEEERLLKLWEGLGYYNRVRNLQKAAQIIMKDYQGQLPSDYQELLKLPGIGSYTAGAIASNVYNIPVPSVDGNVLRVAKRIAGSYDDITKAAVKRQLENDLREIMPEDRPGDFNQSLMELGAVICIPNGKPLCEQCPVMHLCKAFQEGIQMKIPVKSPKKSRKIEDKTLLLIEFQYIEKKERSERLINYYAIQKRMQKGLLAGMWQLPSLEGKKSTLQIKKYLQTFIQCYQNNFDIAIEPLEESKHIFSHIEWHMKGYHIKLIQKKESAKVEDAKAQINELLVYSGATKQQDLTWIQAKQLKDYALPSAFDAYRGYIQ
ncbi:A/G-specific DNA-adenine glycosylase [Lachnotalea glycerini]|uniref:Adenine DNA glycosylase n=1 Tax=Lachnotalea glycerini TaxID=1763509 RepID=A0A255IJL2_9FIRM|nr:A/G-specific adenine glycosylase [Lachnotalea glycerini]PXV96221.1 A/G-specific DNA-adenine glycosylase [Lachnotalea glycerini]RDY31088.1 A/G-specific adenine glycosylase [Lachnotalea glycerini]